MCRIPLRAPIYFNAGVAKPCGSAVAAGAGLAPVVFIGKGGAQQTPPWRRSGVGEVAVRANGDFSGEGPSVDSITLMSGLASSERCRVNCQDWEGGSRFHQGQWKGSNEFPLCFPAWQTGTYCHFA